MSACLNVFALSDLSFEIREMVESRLTSFIDLLDEAATRSALDVRRQNKLLLASACVADFNAARRNRLAETRLRAVPSNVVAFPLKDAPYSAVQESPVKNSVLKFTIAAPNLPAA